MENVPKHTRFCGSIWHLDKNPILGKDLTLTLIEMECFKRGKLSAKYFFPRNFVHHLK